MSMEEKETAGVLAGLEPAAVFTYFEQICGIPHGSGNTEAISRYLEEFAIANDLWCQRDEMGNIIIKKDASPGYEDHEPVILQGHMDMVCVAEEGVQIDFLKDGLSLEVKDGIITAKGTSLGGDDGIAVAMSLAILADDSIPHPPLEVVVTVDEEVGMLGAAAMDTSCLKGRKLLNIDSEEEGILTLGCAGGATVKASLPVNTIAKTGLKKARLKVADLVGGHSGVEIDKGRANACVLLGRVLESISLQAEEEGKEFYIRRLSGGGKDNAIANAAQADISFSADFDPSKAVKESEAIFRKEFVRTEPDLKLILEDIEEEGSVYDAESTDKVIAMLRLLPAGIQKMSIDIPGLVQTSLNLGILSSDVASASATFSVRSSVASEKEEMISRIRTLMKLLGGEVSVSGAYPAWEYKQDSKLREIMVEVFKRQYGKEPVLETIHAGLECGLFSEKLHGVDAVSFGPDMKDIHSPREAMDVASVERTWKYLLEVLRNL